MQSEDTLVYFVITDLRILLRSKVAIIIRQLGEGGKSHSAYIRSGRIVRKIQGACQLQSSNSMVECIAITVTS